MKHLVWKLFIFLFLGTFYLSAQKKPLKKYDFFAYKELSKSYELSKTIKDSILEPSLKKYLDSIVYSGHFRLNLDSIVGTNIYYRPFQSYSKIKIRNPEVYPSFLGSIKDQDGIEQVNIKLKKFLTYYENNGYPFAQAKLDSLVFVKETPHLNLSISKGDFRKYDDWFLPSYPKLPSKFIEKLSHLKKGNTYNQQEIIREDSLLSQHPFLSRSRKSATLFTQDSTIVYFYLNKKKSSKFDGLLGFGNDPSGKLKFTGNIDFELNNSFNRFEQIRLKWYNSNTSNSNLEIGLRFPYLKQSNFGIEGSLQLFRQDSTYVNTIFKGGILYNTSLNSRLSLGIIQENSNFLDDEIPNNNFSDYKLQSYQLAYHYTDYHPVSILAYQWNGFLKIAQGKRKLQNQEDLNQSSIHFELKNHLKLRKSHYLHSRIEMRSLLRKDKNFLQNELYRIGGNRSIRGFNEESILSNNYIIGSLEYKFVANSNFYLSIFSDYSTFDNSAQNITENLVGFGAGFGIKTKIGLLNLSYAMGKFGSEKTNLKEAKVHFGLINKF